jgi:hypothetical protein
MLARVQLTGAPRGASGVYVRAHAAKYYTLLNPPSGGAMVMYQHRERVPMAALVEVAGRTVIVPPAERPAVAADAVEACDVVMSWIISPARQLRTGEGMLKTRPLFESKTDATLFREASSSPVGGRFVYSTGGHWLSSGETKCVALGALQHPSELVVSGLDLGTPYSDLCGLYKRVNPSGCTSSASSALSAARAPAPSKFGARPPLKRLLTDETLAAASATADGTAGGAFPVYEGVRGVGWAAYPERRVYLFRTNAGRWVISWADQINKSAPLCWIRTASVGRVGPANMTRGGGRSRADTMGDDETGGETASDCEQLGSPHGSADPYESDATVHEHGDAGATPPSFAYEVASPGVGWAENTRVTICATRLAVEELRAAGATSSADGGAAPAVPAAAATAAPCAPLAKKRRANALKDLHALAQPPTPMPAPLLQALGALSPLPYEARSWATSASASAAASAAAGGAGRSSSAYGALPYAHRSAHAHVVQHGAFDISLPNVLAPSPRAADQRALSGGGLTFGVGADMALDIGYDAHMRTVDLWKAAAALGDASGDDGGAPQRSNNPRRRACGACDACTAEPCGTCACCVNKKRKKKCVRNRCIVLKEALRVERTQRRAEEKRQLRLMKGHAVSALSAHDATAVSAI